MIKNTASQIIGVQMVSATDGTAFTGTVSCAVTKDGGTQTAGGGTVTHEGNGFHSYTPTQAETDADHIAFTFTGSGAIPATVQVYTIAGDAFTRLGAPAGASIAADLVVIDNFVDDLETRLTATRAGYLDNLSAGAAALEATAQSILTDTAEIGAAGAGLTAINLPNQTMDIVGNITGSLSGSVGSVTGAVGSVTAGVTLAASAVQAIWDALTSALTTVGSIGKLLVDNLNATIGSRSSHSAADVWAAVTRTLTAATNITSTGGTTVPQTGDSFARLGAPAGASIAADLVAIEAQTDDIGAAGAGLTAIPWNASWDAEVQSEVADALEDTIADAIPADGTRPSVKQALYMLTQFMLERSVSSTTVTVKKVDGTTSLFTLTLNDATTPTSITRAT